MVDHGCQHVLSLIHHHFPSIGRDLHQILHHFLSTHFHACLCSSSQRQTAGDPSKDPSKSGCLGQPNKMPSVRHQAPSNDPENNEPSSVDSTGQAANAAYIVFIRPAGPTSNRDGFFKRNEPWEILSPTS